MVHGVVAEAVGRLGGVVVLFGILWAGLAYPRRHHRSSSAFGTGPLLTILFGLMLVTIGLGVVGI